jgi:hypothetical protein
VTLRKLLEYIIILYILISIIIYITKYIYSRSLIRVLLVITKDRVANIILYVNHYYYIFVI